MTIPLGTSITDACRAAIRESMALGDFAFAFNESRLDTSAAPVGDMAYGFRVRDLDPADSRIVDARTHLLVEQYRAECARLYGATPTQED